MMTISRYARILAVLSVVAVMLAALAPHDSSSAHARSIDSMRLSAPTVSVPASVNAGEDICGSMFGTPTLTVTARYSDNLQEIDLDVVGNTFCGPTGSNDSGRSVVIRVVDGNGLATERTVLIN